MDTGAFAVLEAELRARLVDVDRIADRVEARGEAFDGGPAEVDSLGYQLHNLYGACEQVFEVVARFFENRVAAAGYHAGLIKRMQLDIPGVRPALLSESTAAGLDELRRFRHLFRHAYSADLDPDKVARLRPGRAPCGAPSRAISIGFWRACGRREGGLRSAPTSPRGVRSRPPPGPPRRRVGARS